MAIEDISETSGRSLSLTLMPIMAAVFIAFLMIGLALPVLPLHVHDDLGLDGFVVGLVAGGQFAASLVSRVWAGRFADRRGGKLAVIIGLLGAAASGGLYLISLVFVESPVLSVAILLVGRAVLGGAESFIITGAVSWGMMLGGPANTGKVISWIGTAMYAAFAVGAPLGGTLFEASGFGAIALTTSIVPLITLAVVLPQKATFPPVEEAAPMRSVLGAIWLPGIGLAMSSLGFGAMMTFASLLFSERGWTPIWLGVSAFAVSFIVARLWLGHIADTLGGARVALVCLVIEAVGLTVIWLAPNEAVALVGTVLTGFGYSLVYPGFGVEAVRRAPAKARGVAMGTYTAFLDLALGLSSPALGMLAGRGGTGRVFIVSSIVVAAASLIAVRLTAKPPAQNLS
ncbi:MFS family permease [Neorhizobium huautlense]|uniref:MFS family permease n=1 Tax=Neorhizobium huautlense TaxID=67774 RepID=A0ABT9Q028_9HYPH|nr:arabinose transporter [Neorhizobium huautlense]MDP9840085.1 MFS family permease [Neorhizobium huautlense]